MVGTDLKSSLKQAVDEALSEQNPDLADQKYIDVLQIVRMQVGDNETDIANALQAVAKDLESEGRKQHAFDFKQKTCIMLLEFTMMPMPPLPKEFKITTAAATADEPLMKPVMMLHIVDDVDLGKKHYAKTLQTIILDEGETSVTLRSAQGAIFLLMKGSPSEMVPVFQSSKKDDAVSTLEIEGWTSDTQTFSTLNGKAQIYKHAKLGKLALI